MRPDLFVDSSAWFPLVVEDHPDHARVYAALAPRVRAGMRVTTTNLVVAESHALLLKHVGIGTALDFLHRLRNRPNHIVVSSTPLEDRAVSDWLEKYQDKRFSLTDAVSFAVMTDLGISEALTLDRHFATAGFTVLPTLN